MYTGSMVAIVTPMHEDGSVDDDALARLVEFHIENGTDAIVSVGTTGESATLNPTEHMQVVEKTIAFVNKRIPVIAGSGANSTSEAIELTQEAHKLGADACLIVVPYYNKPTQEGLYQHFKTIAEAVPINQILYNVPGRTSCDMQNDITERLSKIPNIIGIKDATNDVARGVDLIQRCGDDFMVVSGEDGTAMELMLAGGKGTISVTANVAPNLMHEMCSAAVAGDATAAKAANDKLIPLHKALFLESNPTPSKWALQDMGLIDGGIRLPLIPLSGQFHEPVRDAMRHAGVI